YAPDHGSQPHHLSSPMVSLSRAEGEKPRLGGQLLLGVVAPIVGASTRALLLKLLTQSPAVSGLHSPISSASFLNSNSFDWMRNQWIPFRWVRNQSPHYYGGCVKMHSRPLPGTFGACCNQRRRI